MNNSVSNVDSANRRAGVRRTVWITAAIALFIFIGFFLQQWFH
jgi:hypothetical protein